MQHVLVPRYERFSTFLGGPTSLVVASRMPGTSRWVEWRGRVAYRTVGRELGDGVGAAPVVSCCSARSPTCTSGSTAGAVVADQVPRGVASLAYRIDRGKCRGSA
jgi:hypothetical protein